MTKVLVVDDSALARRLLSDTLTEAGFDVAVARDGREALAVAATFDPAVVTLDVHMPGLNGLETLDRLMLERPRAVIMISSLTADGSETSLEALSLGAIDVLEKPRGAMSLKMDAFGPRLVAKVKAASTARLDRTYRLAERVRLKTSETRPVVSMEPAALPMRTESGVPVPGLVVIGASTGGPPALDAVLSALPADFPWPIVVAQHMPASFTAALARRLDRICALDVVEADGPTSLDIGRIVIARGDADLVVSRRAGGLVALPVPSSEHFRWHPSVDRLATSAADLIPADRLIGVLLTGMGSDGAASMTAIRRAGGFTIAEAEESAVIWGMPRELVQAKGASVVLPLESIAARLVKVLAP